MQFLERSPIARINQAFARKETRSATVISIMISEVSAYRAIVSRYPQTACQALLRRKSLKQHVSAYFDLYTIESGYVRDMITAKIGTNKSTVLFLYVI